LDSLTEDITQLILALKCHPCHFVGFSMGGMVAQRIALKNPELLKSLILIDTSSEPQDDMLRNRLLLWVAQNFGIKFLANKIMSMFFSAGFMRDKKRAHLREIWKNHFLANDQVSIAKVVRGVIFRKGMTKKLHQINLPTVIMVGANDELTDYGKSKIMHDAIEYSELRVIPRASHMSPVEEPDIVNEIIGGFLRKHFPGDEMNA
jgi:pimeloyl-ACP methyl ester carboxylesterase